MGRRNSILMGVFVCLFGTFSQRKYAHLWFYLNEDNAGSALYSLFS